MHVLLDVGENSRTQNMDMVTTSIHTIYRHQSKLWIELRVLDQ